MNDGASSKTTSGTRGVLDSLKATLGAEVVNTITASRLLLVGAGGIGCELLKNLALCGFRSITVVDLDTIDVSNLNRQLLFRSQHVGQPKCVVACQVAAGLVPQTSKDTTDAVRYIAEHGNVCDNSKFNVQFVKTFDLVLNALDNVVARRRVNRLCLAADKPLIEAGTTGYLGQVTTIHKSSGTACYECNTQETQKVYPICTIRSTPSAPVHCIVWAKELYKLLFGSDVKESMLFEGMGEDSDSHNEAEANGEPSTYMDAVHKMRSLLYKKNVDSDSAAVSTAACALIKNLCIDEIQKQLDMDRYKAAAKKPTVLDASVLPPKIPAPTSAVTYKTTNVWSPEECVAEFCAICMEVYGSNIATGLPLFDKDDDIAMRFVTCASNLRSSIFGIESQSYYAAKGIAGNIIPAIATTNAIVAGLQILQVFEILKAQMNAKSIPDMALNVRDQCSYINCIRNKTRNGLYVTAAKLEDPNPKCFVCSKATISLKLNVNLWNLSDFLTSICKKSLGFEAPSIVMDSGDCIWEEGDDADSEVYAVNLPKLLPELPCGGIGHGAMVTIEDFSQDLQVEILVSQVDVWSKVDLNEDEIPDDHKFILGGSLPKAAACSAAAVSAIEDDSSESDVEILSNVSTQPIEGDIAKSDYKRPAEDRELGRAKKAKISRPDSSQVIEID